ncbi:MAG: hypothetical protein KDJ75_04675 [Alphaproteobacteria bacterium]|nr:hypothetical protein [Alphaproteobacteria bacterium]
MFTHITNLAHTRSITQAFGFFLFYTILLIGLTTFLGHVNGVVSLVDTASISTLVGAGWTMILSSMVLSGKKLTNDMMSVIIAVVGIYLAYTVNVMLGMVVVSYLTTLGK